MKWLSRSTIVSVVIYCVAMTQAAFYQNRAAEPVTHAIWLLLSGFMGVLIGYFEWIANPLILYSWISARKKRVVPALMAALLATAFILSFLSVKKMDWPGMATDTHPEVQGYAAGYWLWLASAVVMVVGSGIELVLGLKRGTLTFRTLFNSQSRERVTCDHPALLKISASDPCERLFIRSRQ